MTVIAIIRNKKGKLMIGGDRRESYDWHYATSMEVPKISKKNGMLLGATGTSDLCSLFVDKDAFEVPERKMESITLYMYHIFKPAVMKFLAEQTYGIKDMNKNIILQIPPESSVELVMGIQGEVWTMVVKNSTPFAESSLNGHIELCRTSAPYSTGCGGQGTPDGIFKYLLQTKGYITKEDFRKALEIVAEISPGVDDQIDILVED